MEKFTEIFFGFSDAAEIFIGYHYFVRLAGGKSPTGLAAAALITVTLMQLCFGCVNSVIGLLSLAVIGKDPDFTAAAMILFNLLSLFLSCLCYEFILKALPDKILCITNITGKSGQASLHGHPAAKTFFIPLIMILCIGIYINHIFYSNTVCKDDLESLSGKSAAMFVFQVMGISAVFCILHIYGEMIGSKIKAEYSRLRAESAESRYEKTRAFRHDVKNHMAVLTGLLKRGDIRETEKYLSGMKIISDDLSLRFQTGRSASDIIINSKLSEAENKGIDISCEMKLPHCKIEDSDLCIILANAVDNAVRACEFAGVDSGKFIKITGIIHGDIFLIEVKNSFDGKKFKWGTGLKNIRTAAEKYGGSVRISCTENIFTLNVLMNISRH